MSADDGDGSGRGRRGRKKRIQRVAEARKEAGMDMQTGPQREATYWLTREETADGILAPMIDVWLYPPVRKSLGPVGTSWFLADEKIRILTDKGPMRAYIGTRTIDMCLKHCRVYPDDGRQCIHVGTDEPNVYTGEPDPADGAD